MSRTHNFFLRKQKWSKIKDQILLTYLKPYLAKMVHTHRPILIADCFAGKGRFDDGEPGSPLIMGAMVKEIRQRQPETELKVVCIEKKYSTELQQNATAFEIFLTCLDGDYEERMAYFVSRYQARRQNLFLYVDPYGIKSIRFAYFGEVTKMGFNTTELLLNFNTFGFLREGCRLLKPGKTVPSDSQDDPDYEPDLESITAMDQIAGGDYWQDIVDRYYDTHDFGLAEEQLSLAYSEKLKDYFPYVLNMPIKTTLTNIPKYRIIHGTCHPDGLILMANTMNKRWRDFREQQQGGQGELSFVWDMPDYNLSPMPRPQLNDVLRDCIFNKTGLKDILACVFKQTGIRYSQSEVIQRLKAMEKAGEITVDRVPEITSKGHKRTGWDHDSKDYAVFVTRKNQWQQNLL